MIRFGREQITKALAAGATLEEYGIGSSSWMVYGAPSVGAEQEVYITKALFDYLLEEGLIEYTAHNRAKGIHSPKDCRPQGQPRLSPAEIRRRNLESLSDAFLKARTALEHNLSIAETSADATYLECEIDRARALLKLAHR